jgi:hypothetical protein
MPKFSINDKVSFLNEKQNGIIKDIKPSGMYVVDIEDGFPIEAAESELVLIRTTIPVARPSAPPKTETVDATPDFIKHLSPGKDAVWLISSPSVSGMVSTGPTDLYLVNTTAYDVLAACSFLKDKQVTGILSEKILSGTQLYITKLRREEAFDKGEILIQLLFHDKGLYIRQPAIHKELSIQFPDLSSAKSTLPAPYAFCRVQQVASTETPDELQLDALHQKFSKKDIQDSLSSKRSKEAQEKSTARSYSASEIDLHIEELTNEIAGLSNGEMLNMQLQYFRKKLDEAIMQKSLRIVFIHGVGNGKLKTAIRQELSSHGFKYTDASYERYGGGATEVML